jgi:hypothetical protein
MKQYLKRIALMGTAALVLGLFLFSKVRANSSVLATNLAAQLQAQQEDLFTQASALNSGSVSLQDWLQQNANLINARNDTSAQLATLNAAQPMPYVTDINIPDNASAEMEQLLITSAQLQNNLTQIQNQQLSATPSGSTSTQTSTQPDEIQQFAQQNGDLLAQRDQLAAQVATQEAQIAEPLPAPPNFSSGTSPALQALATAQYQLHYDRAVFANGYLTASAQARDAALVQWDQQNASRYAQITQLAQALSQSSP